MNKTPTWVKIFGVLMIVAIVLVVGNFVLGGGQHGPGRHMPPTQHASNTTSPANSTASASEHGIGGPANASEATRTLNVTAIDTAFQPNELNVTAGEVVTFVVTNAGRADHEFVLGDASMQSQHGTMRSHMGSMTPHDMANSVHLVPGETKSLTWRFGDVGIEYACHEPSHYEAGMRGTITVS